MADRPGEAIVGLLETARRTGFDSLWLSDDEGGPDASALAGSLVSRSPLTIGIAVEVARRHPSLVAREVISLDLISRGRAALRLRDNATDEPGRLFEALSICEGILAGEGVRYAGQYYVVTMPTPALRPSQPAFPILVDLGLDALGAAGTEPPAKVCTEALDKASSTDAIGQAAEGAPRSVWWCCDAGDDPGAQLEALTAVRLSGVIWRLAAVADGQVDLLTSLAGLTAAALASP
jgi:hypothetical protein